MITKEQCLLKQILSEIDFGRNRNLVNAAVTMYNDGKQYASDMIFMNDENGLDSGLEGYSPSFIVYSLVGENSEYDARDPFFTIENGIKSFDGYGFERMLKPEDMQKLLSKEVLEELDDSDFFEAFERFLQTNYPQIHENFDYNALDDYDAYDYMKANWDELAKSIGQQQEGGQAVKLSESDLKKIINKTLSEVNKRRKK